MKEGASNCVERHLNLNDCDTSLLWTYSQVGRKCCFHSQRITPHASRLRYTARRTQAYVRVYTALARGDSKLRFTITAMEQERESEIERLRKRQATTPHRSAKRSRLLEAKLRSKTGSRPPPQMTAQLGHFQLLTPRGNSKRVYSTGGSGQTIINPLECSGW